MNTCEKNVDITKVLGLDALQAKTEEMISKKKKQLLISLVFDEMSIQRNLTYSRATNR